MTAVATDRARAESFRRTELASFLRRRREATRPEDVGLPAGGRRRTPGLRREEVAVLAHVGVSWYTWIEQGRELSVSPAVLEAIAGALRLTPPERRYLFELAGLGGPVDDHGDDDATGSASRLQALVDAVERRPAYGVDRYWNVLATNALARYVFGIEPGSNCLVDFFVDASTAGRFPLRDVVGPMLVAQLREQAARYAWDDGFTTIVRDLSAVSEDFRSLWDAHVVGVVPHVDLVYDHPSLGRLSFEPSVLTPFQGGDQRVFVYIPKAATSTADALARVV
ncbi:helix-turn-helix transcriptional regulator [Cellulosimicrobium composti]|uniref:Transcriptional regulator n=1 Tax=Cellulosimicrobium composti TaxID=2672572 RepID=A0ABX0B7H5_9MICO|nr:helix-turn-helix transcriptional regulator [Cellulosimicrobium composti]NDO88628.1 transcriptional regulator [Cellulosimicrobium composti]